VYELVEEIMVPSLPINYSFRLQKLLCQMNFHTDLYEFSGVTNVSFLDFSFSVDDMHTLVLPIRASHRQPQSPSPALSYPQVPDPTMLGQGLRNNTVVCPQLLRPVALHRRVSSTVMVALPLLGHVQESAAVYRISPSTRS
jgi:hypothetical protein